MSTGDNMEDLEESKGADDDINEFDVMCRSQEAVEAEIIEKIQSDFDKKDKSIRDKQRKRRILGLNSKIKKLKHSLEYKRNLLNELSKGSVSSALYTFRKWERLERECGQLQSEIDRKESEKLEPDVSCVDVLNFDAPNETEQERLIRIGEINPFELADTGEPLVGCSRVEGTGTDRNGTGRPTDRNGTVTDRNETGRPTDRNGTGTGTTTSDEEAADPSYQYSSDDSGKLVEDFGSAEVKWEFKKGVYKSQCEAAARKKVKRTKAAARKALDKSKRIPNKLRKDSVVDDWNETQYRKRQREYQLDRLLYEGENGLEPVEGGLRVPLGVWRRLYEYQRSAVRWLFRLDRQGVGGVLGDEMGLGKTVEVVGFLAGLASSGLGPGGSADGPGGSVDSPGYRGLGPVLVVAPTTVLHQWVREFHRWWPPFRVAILHDCGSYVGDKRKLIRETFRKRGVLVTSYTTLRINAAVILALDWHYAILDEGHCIRNPEAAITRVCKRLRTPHRLILSGSPLQNNLRELWSLIDFVYPGKLSSLSVFMEQFSVPILQGGYANASPLQVRTAYTCACVLRDTIKPYLLRRLKADLGGSLNLPNKKEHILFCKLSQQQVHLYRDYLSSKEVSSILSGSLQVFTGLIKLRKICNHPDLVGVVSKDETFGAVSKSGKLTVVESLLKMWKRQGHKVLVFSQSRQMLDILELLVVALGFNYSRMDGTTGVRSRQTLIAGFNGDPDKFVFLLTTRVGGLGVNLTGADRVVLYDPDWNPSTDVQARERAWRIGQTRDVTIYRLVTTGTIEEKIYHRQIFKQFLANRILKDPRQRRFFKSNDLFELFSFLPEDDGRTDTQTAAIFAGTGANITQKSVAKRTQYKTPKVAKQQSKQTGVNEPEVAVSDGAAGPSGKGDEFTALLKSWGLSNNSSSKTISQLQSKYTPMSKPRTHSKVKVDGEAIDNVVRKSVYKTAKSESSVTNEDDYVLGKLFRGSGVHSALQHDTIMDCSRADYKLVELEAEKVASNAVEALKRNRWEIHRDSVAKPKVPRFGQSKSFLLSSSTVLNNIRKPEETSSTFKRSKTLPVTDSDDIRDTFFSFDQPSRNESVLRTTVKSPSKAPLSSALTSSSRTYTASPSMSSTQSHSNSSNSNTPFVIPTSPTSSSVSSNTPSSSSPSSVTPSSSSPSSVTPSSSSASSSALLQRIRARNSLTVPVPVDGLVEHADLVKDVRDFVCTGAATFGFASTAEVIDQFKHRVVAGNNEVFKHILKELCFMERTSDGQGIWILKPEFK